MQNSRAKQLGGTGWRALTRLLCPFQADHCDNSYRVQESRQNPLECLHDEVLQHKVRSGLCF